MSVVTRFAPSPTGFLHIGGARTALFNYLFARHHGGSYLVRIEDTDKKRSTAEAIDAIRDGLSWLGLSGDEEMVMQSAREERHQAVAYEMLAAGTAYKCFLSTEELDEVRQQARADGRPVRSPWRDRDDHPSDMPYVVRIRMPEDGSTTLDDMVQGRVSVDHDKLDDLVILRSDGSPTYMLAVVVDDHDMNVTHVLRGDDHLNNAFRQYQIYQAAGWQPPQFGHIPLIHGADGAKLSKRHGALGVDAYRDMGFLPEAVVNYLARLGWSHGDDELFSLEQAISWFDGSNMGKSAARFDMEKLTSVNSHWMRQMPADRLADMVIAIAGSQGAAPTGQTKIWLTDMMPLFTDRASTLNALYEQTDWLFSEQTPELSEADKDFMTDEVKKRLLAFKLLLVDASPEADILTEQMKIWLAENNLKMKDIGIPLRIALTGRRNAPSLVDLILGLGLSETIKRIDHICL